MSSATARATTASPADPSAFRPGLEGFTFEDLYRPAGLRRLHQRFLQELASADAALAARFEAYRAAGGKGPKPPEESALLIDVARHLARFVGRLFGVEAELQALSRRLTSELRLFEYRKEFIARRVFKKGAPDRPAAAELPSLEARVKLMLKLGFPADADAERYLAESI